MLKEILQTLLAILFVLGLIWLIALFPYHLGKSVGYRAGQIDALTGATYYKLEKQSNYEFRWVECEGICRYEEGK